MSNARAGTVYVSLDGERQDAKGSFTCNSGGEKRDAIIGADRVHGFKAVPQVPFVEGAITDSSTLDINKLKEADGVIVTVEFRNGKIFTLSDAWYAGEGSVTSEEGEIAVRWESSTDGVWS